MTPLLGEWMVLWSGLLKFSFIKGEAAAMRPKSLWQVLTETWWSSLKRAKHVLRLEIRAGARGICIWTESKWTPKNTVRWERERALFLVFILRPRAWMWQRTTSLWRLTDSLWARMSQLALFHWMVRYDSARLVTLRYGTAQFRSVCVSTAV